MTVPTPASTTRHDLSSNILGQQQKSRKWPGVFRGNPLPFHLLDFYFTFGITIVLFGGMVGSTVLRSSQLVHCDRCDMVIIVPLLASMEYRSVTRTTTSNQERTEEDNSDGYMLDFTWLGLTRCRRSAYPRVRLGRGDLFLYAYCNFFFPDIVSFCKCLSLLFFYSCYCYYIGLYMSTAIWIYIGIPVGSRGSQSGLADDGSVVTAVTVFYRPRIL